ncbi:MAG: Wzz/FepE/Etk N-terminal domain-containing protein [Ferruginibacter sp.]
MKTTELIRGILQRLARFKILILAAGIAAALLLFFYAKSKRPVYTAKATIFPLTSTLENSLSSNTLSGILGLGDAPKSFSSEATINIIELTLSRYVREAVAAERLKSFGNKTITQLLIEDYNSNRSFLEKDIPLPADSITATIEGGELLKAGIVAKMSKNGVLEVYFSHANKALISPVSYVLIDKVSQFYIDLKIKKATADYNFTVKKIDSLDAILSTVDRRAIRMQNTTLFAPDRLEYEIPKDRINADKQRYTRQRDISLNNQEEALWRLQKLTPIISVLDKPTEPFTVSKPSALIYAIIGLITGSLLAAFLLVFGLLYKYVKSEIHRSLLDDEVSAPAGS